MTRPQDTARTLGSRARGRPDALLRSGPQSAEGAAGPAHPGLRVGGHRDRLWPLGRLRALVTRRSSLALTLDPRVPLDLEIAGGVAGLRADLRELDIRALTISGGASDVVMDLPAPAHELPVRIEGGASRTVVRRPTDAPVSVEIDGGASGLSIDDERLGAIGGHVNRHAGRAPRARPDLASGAHFMRIAAAT